MNFFRNIANLYNDLETHHPSALGRFYAFLNALSGSLISVFIKKAQYLDKMEMNYIRCFLAFFAFYYGMRENRKEIWPESSEEKSTLFIRMWIAGAGGILMTIATGMLDVQLLLVIFALNTPLTVIFEALFWRKKKVLPSGFALF